LDGASGSQIAYEKPVQLSASSLVTEALRGQEMNLVLFKNSIPLTVLVRWSDSL